MSNNHAPGPATVVHPDDEVLRLAAEFTSPDQATSELVERIAHARWFMRTARTPAPVEQRLLNEVASSSGTAAAAWLDGWESVPEVTARLDLDLLGEVDALRKRARERIAAAGRGHELTLATHLASLAVPVHAVAQPDVSEHALRVGLRVAAYWLNGLLTVTIGDAEPGPLDAAGQLLLWGRLPVGVDDAGWWVL